MTISTVYRVLGQLLHIKRKNLDYSIQIIFYLWKVLLEWIHSCSTKTQNEQKQISNFTSVMLHRDIKSTSITATLSSDDLQYCCKHQESLVPLLTRMTRTATWLNNSFIQRALPDGCTGQVSPTDRQALPTRCGMPTSSHILANRAVSLLQVDNFVGWISLTRGQTSTRQHMKPLLYGCSGTNESKLKAHCSLKDVHCSLNLLI